MARSGASPFVPHLTSSFRSLLTCRLADVGFDVGVRMLELLVHREKSGKRENRILGILSFLHTNVWKNLFGKTADSLERGTSVSATQPPKPTFRFAREPEALTKRPIALATLSLSLGIRRTTST